MTLEESNKLIADFMGLSTVEKHGELLWADWDGLHSTKYHTSWDWLMPVIEKIESIPIVENVRIAESFVNIQVVNKDGISHTTFQIFYTNNGRYFKQEDDLETKIQAVYQAVTQFIQWYNLNDK